MGMMTRIRVVGMTTCGEAACTTACGDAAWFLPLAQLPTYDNILYYIFWVLHLFSHYVVLAGSFCVYGRGWGRGIVDGAY
jgi:hypothetical protein